MLGNRRWLVIALLLVTAVSVSLLVRYSGTDSPPKKCFMWKVTSATTTVYLMGAIHVGCEDFYPLSPEVEDAFKTSKYLVVESDIDKVGFDKREALTIEKGMYKGEETLSKALSKETLLVLTDYCTKNKIPIATLDKYRPWMVCMIIQLREARKLGLRQERGVDTHFSALAKINHKDVLALEDFGCSTDVFASVPDEMYDKCIRYAVRYEHNER